MMVLIAVLAVVVAIVAYVISSRRKERETDEYKADIDHGFETPTRVIPMVRPSPLRSRRAEESSRPWRAASDEGSFGHVPTDYGTYTPTSSTALEAEDSSTAHGYGHHTSHEASSSCSPTYDAGHHASHDAGSSCSVDTSYGGGDFGGGGGHHD